MWIKWSKKKIPAKKTVLLKLRIKEVNSSRTLCFPCFFDGKHHIIFSGGNAIKIEYKEHVEFLEWKFLRTYDIGAVETENVKI